MVRLRIGLVGDFDREKRSHWATEAALFHAAARVGVTVEPSWRATASIHEVGAAARLGDVDGIWGAPGSPYVSMPGALSAIRHARERNVPYLGTCAGFQYALVEFTRGVLGIADADSAENGASSDNIVITPVDCPVPRAQRSQPALAGLGLARPVPGTVLAELCEGAELREEYFCNFETNPAYQARWEAAGLRVAARGPAGEMRAFELPQKRFFVATLFQPQLSSSHERPHPVVEGFLRACAAAQLGV
jgi:CTP synthase (UTP-ammonia lyase)